MNIRYKEKSIYIGMEHSAQIVTIVTYEKHDQQHNSNQDVEIGKVGEGKNFKVMQVRK